MAVIQRTVAKCDLCATEWIPVPTERNPTADPSKVRRCASCKSPRWNGTIHTHVLRPSSTTALYVMYPSEFRAWSDLKQRCLNAHHKQYADYGGRGIKVCDRWIESFANFLEDVGPKPSANLSIDRYPNNDGNYEPSNVRWATQSEQNKNRRTYKRNLIAL